MSPRQSNGDAGFVQISISFHVCVSIVVLVFSGWAQLTCTHGIATAIVNRDTKVDVARFYRSMNTLVVMICKHHAV